MAKAWKIEVLREQPGGGVGVRAQYIVALSDQMAVKALLKSKEGFLDEKIEVIGEADQALIDRWHIKTGDVFCVVAWS